MSFVQPRKRPLQADTVTDEQGRRRFHGAFTGGFSAGYYNTVGSEEGFKPQTFVSGRSKRSDAKKQSVLDFADSEDGLLGGNLLMKDEYSGDPSHSTTNWLTGSLVTSGPILKELILPSNNSIGTILMKKMGWKHGQGVGNRVKINDMHEHVDLKNLPRSALDQDGITVTRVQENFVLSIPIPKTNQQGLGYLGGRNISTALTSKVSSTRYSVSDMISSSNYEYYDDDDGINGYGDALAVCETEEIEEDSQRGSNRDGIASYLGQSSEMSSTCPTDGRPSLQGFILALNSVTPLTDLETISAPAYYIPSPSLLKTHSKARTKPSRWDTAPAQKAPSVFSLLSTEGLAKIQMTKDQNNKSTPEATSVPEMNGTVETIVSQDVREALVRERNRNRFIGLSDAFKSRFVTSSIGSSVAVDAVSGLTTTTEFTEKVAETRQSEADLREKTLASVVGRIPARQPGRITSIWAPAPLLCKRFNVPVPINGTVKASSDFVSKNLLDHHLTPYIMNQPPMETENIQDRPVATESNSSDLLVNIAMSVAVRLNMSKLKSIFDSDSDEESVDCEDIETTKVSVSVTTNDIFQELSSDSVIKTSLVLSDTDTFVPNKSSKEPLIDSSKIVFKKPGPSEVIEDGSSLSLSNREISSSKRPLQKKKLILSFDVEDD